MPIWTVGETEDDEDSGDFLTRGLRKALQEPDVQARVLQEAEAQNIPPGAIRAFLAGEDIEFTHVKEAVQKANEADEGQEAPAGKAPEPSPGIPDTERGIEPEQKASDNETMPETSEPERPEMSVEEINALLDDLIGVLGEDTTLGELKERLETNPELADLALSYL